MGGSALVHETRGSHGRKNQCGKIASPDDRLYEKIRKDDLNKHIKTKTNERDTTSQNIRQRPHSQNHLNNMKTTKRETTSQNVRQKTDTIECDKVLEVISNTCRSERVPCQHKSHHATSNSISSDPWSQKSLNKKNNEKKTNERTIASQKTRKKNGDLEIMSNGAERVPCQQTSHRASSRSSNPCSEKNQSASCGNRPGAFHIFGPGVNPCDIESQQPDQNQDHQGSETLISAVLVPEEEDLGDSPPIVRASKFSGYIVNTKGWKFRLARSITFVIFVMLCGLLVAWFAGLGDWVNRHGWIQENDWIMTAVPTTLAVLIVIGMGVLWLFEQVSSSLRDEVSAAVRSRLCRGVTI